MKIAGTEYDRAERAGAFGDLGTLVPFVVAYVTVAGLEPQGVLLGFGLLALITGLVFRTPLPVQPMKAIATVASTYTALATPAAVFVSAVATGVLWLVMGATGAVSWLAALSSRPVVRGIVLGLGLSFIVEGVRLMSSAPVLGVIAAVATVVSLGQTRVPAMLVLLALGIGSAVWLDPTLVHDLSGLAPSFRLPALHVPGILPTDLMTGVLVLAVPQAALTLGNAVIATAEEHNALFPHRPIGVRRLAFDHAIMNLLAAPIGGVPMCRGAGGMAGHVRFGARTGGALVILGLVLLAVALFFPDSVRTLFRLFPMPILGAILLFAGIELAAGVDAALSSRTDRVVLVVTAGVALWNMGLGYLCGLVLYHASARRWLRL